MSQDMPESKPLLEAWLPLVRVAWALAWRLDREPPMVLTGESGPLVVEIHQGDASTTPTVTVWVDDQPVLADAPVATPHAAVAQAHAAFVARRAAWLAVPSPTPAAAQEATPPDTGRVP
ncbi:MAG TPA: hypothetical protein VFS21_38895 [Roseiflexaceae bacterium]|nr:hypothetical protein [Roseiflexaceae bacterium]